MGFLRITKICSFCQKKVFTIPSLSNTTKYCSRNCYRKDKSKTITKKMCFECGKEFKVGIGKYEYRKYCSNSCRNKTIKRLVMLTCRYCGKQKLMIPYLVKKQKYCSYECMGKARRGIHVLHKYSFISKKIKKICIICNKEFWLPKSYITKKRIRCCSKKCFSIAILGENNPNWKGGLSFEPYGLSWTKKIRKLTRERDNYTCQICNKHQTQLKRRLSIHHIDYNKINSFLNNLITLCGHCHAQTNFNRKIWIKQFHNFLSQKHDYNYTTIQQKTLILVECVT